MGRDRHATWSGPSRNLVGDGPRPLHRSAARRRTVNEMVWTCATELYRSCKRRPGCASGFPIHRALAKILAEVPRRSIYIATNTHGAPWTQDGFRRRGAAFLIAWNSRAGSYSTGSGRAVVMLLEAGCTTAEVASITGQSFEMVEHYARRSAKGSLRSRRSRNGRTLRTNRVCTTGQLILYNAPSASIVTHGKDWSGRHDSNTRPSAPKADALPG